MTEVNETDFKNKCIMSLSNTLSPFVYWAQTEKGLSLRVDLRNVKDTNVNLTEDELEFSANGIGAKGENDYHFVLRFYKNVDPEDSQYKITDREVDFSIVKKEEEWWPRLMSETKKPVWLKVDFDKLKTEDDSENEMEDVYERPLQYDDLLNDISKSRKRTRKKVEDFRKVYLFLYNLFQFVGFLYVFIVLTIKYTKDGPLSMGGTYTAVGTAMKFCTLLQILEVLHVVLGYTTGNALLPAVQEKNWFKRKVQEHLHIKNSKDKLMNKDAGLEVFGRLSMVFLMIDAEPRMQTKPVVFYLFLVYSSVEIIRYPYYMVRTYGFNVGFLTWLRYTAWIPLYPLGFLCEGVIILRNIPYFEETKKFSLELPNIWNFSFYFPTIMRLYLLLGFFPTLYCFMNSMYKQRVKVLGRKKEEKEC